MHKAIETRKRPTADEIAELADEGENISRFFTGKGKMMPPGQVKETRSGLVDVSPFEIT